MTNLARTYLLTALKRLSGACAMLALLSAPALAATVDIKPVMRVGDRFGWDYRKETMQTAEGRGTKKTASVTPVTAKVIEASSTGYVLEWQYGDTRFLDAARAKAMAQQDNQWMADLAKALRFELLLAPDGQFVQLRNYAALRPAIDRMLAQVLAAVAKERQASPEERQQVGEMMRGMFATREQVETLLLKDVRLLLFPFGLSLDSAAPLTYQTALPNPFGGEALTAEGTVSLASVNARRGQASIRIEQKLSPDSVPRILNALVRELGDKRPPAEEFARLKADITDTSHYTVDLRSGFSNRVEFTRTTTLPGGSRTDKVSYSRTR